MNARRFIGTALALAVFVLASAAAWAKPDDPPASIYHLEAKLVDQDGKQRPFDAFRGQPVLVTMFYSSCQATCPLIVETLRATERAMRPADRSRVHVLLISIDPERDTPARLRAVAVERHIDTSRWTLARASEGDVRKIAALLNVQYRKLPSGDFSHSTAIALLSTHGQIEASSQTLGHADPAILAKLGDASSK